MQLFLPTGQFYNNGRLHGPVKVIIEQWSLNCMWGLTVRRCFYLKTIVLTKTLVKFYCKSNLKTFCLGDQLTRLVTKRVNFKCRPKIKSVDATTSRIFYPFAGFKISSCEPQIARHNPKLKDCHQEQLH